MIIKLVEGTTESIGTFKLWTQTEPEPLPPGETQPTVAPVALDLTGKVVTLTLRKPDGTAVTVTGVSTNLNQTTNKGEFTFAAGTNDFTWFSGTFMNTVTLIGHWKVTTTATGKIAFHPEDDSMQIEIIRA